MRIQMKCSAWCMTHIKHSKTVGTAIDIFIMISSTSLLWISLLLVEPCRLLFLATKGDLKTHELALVSNYYTCISRQSFSVNASVADAVFLIPSKPWALKVKLQCFWNQHWMGIRTSSKQYSFTELSWNTWFKLTLRIIRSLYLSP